MGIALLPKVTQAMAEPNLRSYSMARLEQLACNIQLEISRRNISRMREQLAAWLLNASDDEVRVMSNIVKMQRGEEQVNAE